MDETPDEIILQPRLIKREFLSDSCDMDLGAESTSEWVVTDHLEINFTLSGSAMTFHGVLPFDDPELPTLLRNAADWIEMKRKEDRDDTNQTP